MNEDKIVISKEDKVLEELEAEVEEEGMCYGNYSARANACKECFINDKCKEETKNIKKKIKK